MVIPRPIALITTLSADGIPNAGSFSFFNILTHDPAIKAIEHRPDGTPKDTAASILATGQFTVHISDHALVDQMEICSIKFAPDVDELAIAGLETAPGQTARSPRILAAPAAFECRLVQTVPVAPARVIVLGQVQRVRETLVDRETLHVDQIGIDAVGRLGGHLYARQLDQFERVTPTVEQFMAGREDNAMADWMLRGPTDRHSPGGTLIAKEFRVSSQLCQCSDHRHGRLPAAPPLSVVRAFGTLS